MLNADGLGFRGSALRTGDGEGYVEYAAKGNINTKEGTIEFWMYAKDWELDDGHIHRFIDVRGEGNIDFHIWPPGVMELLVQASSSLTSRSENTAYGSNPTKGRWSWFAITWQEGKPLGLYVGNISPAGKGRSHDCSPRLGNTPVPEKLLKILIGDFGGRPGRQAHTLIDEVYIYDRALTREEVTWVTENALTRKQGMDIPADFMRPRAKIVPDPAKSTLVVEIDSGDRSGNFAGLAHLEPPAGTSPAPITVTKGRFGQAVIPYTDLPQGDYQVIWDITTQDGKPGSSVTTKFVVPTPPVWLEEKVGVSNTPPPPWTPVKVEQDRVRMWGRDYQLGAFGLPAKVETQGASMLARPVSFSFVADSSEVNWTPRKRLVTKTTEAEVVWEGTSRSAIGVLSWRTQTEYDGFLLHDLSLAPAEGAAVELMELRIPIRKEFALLYSKGARIRGFLPKGEGPISGAGHYWWIGTDDLGLCGATEHNGSLIDGADGAFSIVRESNGDITVVYRFVGKPTALTSPWKLRLVLQATPTKPLPADWRTWRDAACFGGSPENYNAWKNTVNLWITYPWHTEKTHLYHPYPVVRDANWYRDYVKNLQANGGGLWRDSQTVTVDETAGMAKRSGASKVTPYALFAFMAPGIRECDFYWKQWYNPLGFSSLGDKWDTRVAMRPVPSYVDFMVWKHRELIREYGHDGLYIDFPVCARRRSMWSRPWDTSEAALPTPSVFRWWPTARSGSGCTRCSARRIPVRSSSAMFPKTPVYPCCPSVTCGSTARATGTSS